MALLPQDLNKVIVIFDLDGVLLDAREIHYNVLNQAIEEIAGPEYVISREDHLGRFDGLGTFLKLNILVDEGKLPKSLWPKIFSKKQELTIQAFNEIKPDKELYDIISEIKKLGVDVYCASNSVRDTVKTALTNLGIIDLFSAYYGNDDVREIKPNPQIHIRCMYEAAVGPTKTLIVEDSPTGRKSAELAGGHTLFIENRSGLTLEKILNSLAIIAERPRVKYTNKNLNVLVPMAGAGNRFAMAGYSFPKPLIEVNGKPMIQAVVESLFIEANYIYIVQREHYERYSLKYLLNLVTPKCKIIQIDGMTEGAACTTLLAQEYINNSDPLIIANSDQIISWYPEIFLHSMISDNLDGGILTFKATHPKWSYAKIDDKGFVTEVAEKKPISDLATVGVYYWKKGSDYVKYANQMIDKNCRVNNEFYVCPVFNEAIADGKKFKTYSIAEMWGIGTPEDLERYLNK